MSDPGMQKQKNAEQQIQFTATKEAEISALQRKLGLAPQVTEKEEQQDALHEVRSKVAENMPMTLTDKMIQWRTNNERVGIRKGKSAKGLISPEKMSVRNHLQIFRTSLAVPISADKKERALEAKHIKDGLEKMREACAAWRAENPGDPQTDEDEADLRLVQKIEAEILGQENALNNGIDELLESKEEMTGSWIAMLAGNGVNV